MRHPRLLPAGDETQLEVALDALRTAVLAELVTLLPAAWRQYNKTRLAAHAVLGGRWRGSSGRTAAASGPRCCAAWMCRRRMRVGCAGWRSCVTRTPRLCASRASCGAASATSVLDGLRRDSPDVYAAVWMA